MTPSQLKPLQDAEITAAKACRRLLQIKSAIADLKNQEKELNDLLLATMQQNEVLQLKTNTFTISRAKRITPRITNFAAAKEALNAITEVKTKEVFDDCMTPVIKALLDNNTNINGIETLVTEYTIVRDTKRKEK